MNNPLQTAEHCVRVAQIIAVAMILAVVVFGIVGVVVSGQFPGANVEEQEQIISLVMAAASLPELLAFFFVPQMVTEELLQRSRHMRTSTVSEEFMSYQAKFFQTVVQFALLEGASLMNIVAYIIEKNWWSLGISGAFVLIMLTNFPTRTRFDHYAETQQTFL